MVVDVVVDVLVDDVVIVDMLVKVDLSMCAHVFC